MVIKLLQQLTFRRYAAIVLSPFFYFCCFRCVIVPLTGVINYVFCIYILVSPALADSAAQCLFKRSAFSVRKRDFFLQSVVTVNSAASYRISSSRFLAECRKRRPIQCFLFCCILLCLLFELYSLCIVL